MTPTPSKASPPTIDPDHAAEASRWRLRAAFIGLVMVTVIAYIPALDGGFIWDDDDYVWRNPHLLDWAGLVRVWQPGVTLQYYPVVFTSFWIERQLWGLDTFGYHLVNVLLHAGNAALLWQLMRRLGVPGAGVIAAVFALHPVHVESVAWITERKNVLSTFFALGSASTYLGFLDGRRGGRRWLDYAACIVLFTLAVLAKSVTCSLPAALVLVMIFRRDTISPRSLAPLIPLFAIGIVAAMHTAHLERINVGAVGAEFDRTMAERLLVAARALIFYPMKIVWPWPLMFIYPRWAVDPTSVLGYWPIAVVLAAATTAVTLLIRGCRGPFVALAFFAGTVFPALGFFNVFPHQFSFVADHFQYLASIGIIALVVATLVTIAGARRQLIVGALVLPPLFALTWLQAATYESAETVWRDTLAKNENAWLAHNNLSTILLRQADAARRGNDPITAGRIAAEARTHAETATTLRASYHIAHANLSEAMRLQGDDERALDALDRAIAIVEAEMDRAGVTAPPVFLTDYQLRRARLLRLTGDDERAVDVLRVVLKQRPADVGTRRELAAVLVQLRRYEDAAVEYAIVLRATPEDAAVLGTLAALREEIGDYAEADRLYRRAFSASEGAGARIQASVRLIRFLTNCPDDAHRDLDEATRIAEGLVQATGRRDAAALDVLASVHAAAGRWDDAIVVEAEAVVMLPADDRSMLSERIRANLIRYREEAANASHR